MKAHIYLIALAGILLDKSIATAQATTTASTTAAGAVAKSTTSPTVVTRTITSASVTSTSSKKTPTAILTTIFTPPSSCQTVGFTSWTTKSGSPPMYWRNAYTGGNDGSTASCYPASFRALAQNNGYYSPGVCPSGWHVAEVARTVSTAPWTSRCCPSSMSFDGFACISTVTTSTSIWVGPGTQRPITGTWLAADWPLRVLWESDDLKDFTPASAPLLNTATSVSTRTTAMSSNDGDLPDGAYSTDFPSAAPSRSGLTGGAIAGIVIGAIAGIVLLLVAVWFLLKLRRRRALQKSSGGFQRDYKPVTQDAQHELAAGEYKPELAAQEKARAELAAGDVPPAAKVQSEPAELDGGQYDLRTTGQQRVNGTTYG